ncbi:unannotated protein [freshwater metagenome]|uniref:Unannotated protein n=1 Tax=freshwater metagenome TaxID=449393 RepID=A0A6J6Q913_9ZZZZ
MVRRTRTPQGCAATRPVPDPARRVTLRSATPARVSRLSLPLRDRRGPARNVTAHHPPPHRVWPWASPRSGSSQRAGTNHTTPGHACPPAIARSRRPPRPWHLPTTATRTGSLRVSRRAGDGTSTPRRHASRCPPSPTSVMPATSGSGSPAILFAQAHPASRAYTPCRRGAARAKGWRPPRVHVAAVRRSGCRRVRTGGVRIPATTVRPRTCVDRRPVHRQRRPSPRRGRSGRTGCTATAPSPRGWVQGAPGCAAWRSQQCQVMPARNQRRAGRRAAPVQPACPGRRRGDRGAAPPSRQPDRREGWGGAPCGGVLRFGQRLHHTAPHRFQVYWLREKCRKLPEARARIE